MPTVSDEKAGRKTSTQQSVPAGLMEMLVRSSAVFIKDVTCEFRTRYAVNTILLFAVTTLVAVSFSVGTARISPSIQAALLWIIIYFSALSGLSRAFVREEEGRTAMALKLSAAPGAVFGGKLLFNLVLLIMLELVTIPLFAGMMNLQVKGWTLFLTVLVSGSAGLAVAATIVAAIVSKANAKGALFAVLSLPLLLPILVGGIHGVQSALTSPSFAAGMQDVKLLVSYTGIMFILSLFLFGFIWED
jgi:heme exporter protein B